MVPQSGTDYHPQQYTGSISPLSGNSFFGHMYPQLRCFAACSGFHYKGPAPRNPQLILNLLAFVGAGLRRDAIASYVCYGSLWLSSNKSQFAFVVLSPLRYESGRAERPRLSVIIIFVVSLIRLTDKLQFIPVPIRIIFLRIIFYNLLPIHLIRILSYICRIIRQFFY